jgi:hypothetical protein
MLEAMATANALIRLKKNKVIINNGIDECTRLSEASDSLLENGAPNLESHLLQPENERQLFQIAKRTELGEMAVFYFQPRCF